MITKTRKYSVSFPVKGATKRTTKRSFYELAKKHIVKGKRGGKNDLSLRVDKIVYGVG